MIHSTKNAIMISMKSLKGLIKLTLSICFLLSVWSIVNAENNVDFLINTHTDINYTTGNDFVTIKNTYERKVQNGSYYFSREGEKVFHIPDLATTDENIQKERAFKLDSLRVLDDRGKPLKYTKEELPSKEGIYIHIPYYKATTKSTPYKIIMTYKTHDNIIKSGNLVTITGSSLPKDTIFQKKDPDTGTTTQFNYDFSITTDKNIPPLAKAFPKFTKEEDEKKNIYNFTQHDRLEKSPTLEFGTSVTYRFEIEYKTPKTDNFIPLEYTKVFKAISTNIYEISLPREYAEINQTVTIDHITPTPKNIYRDQEGNVIVSFEVQANKEDVIKVTGYIKSSQKAYDLDTQSPADTDLEEYLKKIKEDKNNSKYLAPTKYWEVKDPFIQENALRLLENKKTLLELIEADYQYVNDTLEYDTAKANSNNERIGAVSALKGGASVCMEYADSMIAILRAQGVPVRAALGYTNITDEPLELVRHQWLEIWIPGYGWLSVDPTFESNNRKIGQLIERVLWETFNENSLSNISVFSADKLTNFTDENLEIKVYAIDSEKINNEGKSYTEIIPYKDLDSSSQHSLGGWFNSLLKATVLGRAILITIPIIVTITILIIILLSIKLIVRKVKKKRNKSRIKTTYSV